MIRLPIVVSDGARVAKLARYASAISIMKDALLMHED